METSERDLKVWLDRAKKAESAANQVLAHHELSAARIIELNHLLLTLASLPVDVKDLFSEAVTCLQLDLRRSAIVVSWAGFFSTLVERLFQDHELTLRSVRPKWQFTDLHELKEGYPESQILDSAKEVKLVKKTDLKVYHGQLSTRNKCAHPTLFRPNRNGAIGFVNDMLDQTKLFL